MKRGGEEESQSASIPPCTVCAASAPGRTVGGWTPHWEGRIAFSATGATRGVGNGEGIRTTAINATGWRSNEKFKNLVILAALYCLPHPPAAWFGFGFCMVATPWKRVSVGCLPMWPWSANTTAVQGFINNTPRKAGSCCEQ